MNNCSKTPIDLCFLCPECGEITSFDPAVDAIEVPACSHCQADTTTYNGWHTHD